MKHIKKISILLLCLLLAFGTILPVSASDDYEEKPEWEISEDLGTLTYGDRVYERAEISWGVWLRSDYYYQYRQVLEIETGTRTNIRHPILTDEQGKEEILWDIVFLNNAYNASYQPLAVYVNANSKHIIDDFNAGNYAQYELGWYSRSAVIEENAAKAWMSATPDLSLDAQDLTDAPYHYVFAYDQTLTLCKVFGVIFEVDGGYVYVDGAHCLDFEGYLALRPGDLPALQLQGQDAALVADATERFVNHSLNFKTEEAEPVESSAAMAVFLLIASPLLFILPALLLALGIVMRCLKKIPNRKRWNIVIILSSVWLGGSVITSLLLLIPTFFL